MNLQRFLAVRNANRIALTPDMEHYGKHVRVIAGIFAGCEGVIEGPSSRRRNRPSRLNPNASALNSAASLTTPAASAAGATLCVRIMGTTVAAVADIDRDYLVEV